ncbi:unnamed protein product, partial [Ectocarpus sp. 4 AP-2014]
GGATGDPAGVGVGVGVPGVSMLATDGSTVDLTQIAMLIIRLLAQQQLFLAFLEPVDLVALPLYGALIKRPMDLQSMYYKVQFGSFGGLHPSAVPNTDPPPVEHGGPADSHHEVDVLTGGPGAAGATPPAASTAPPPLGGGVLHDGTATAVVATGST